MLDNQWKGFGIRLVFALILVYTTYNPSGYSFTHWVLNTFPKVNPWICLAAVALTIGWAIYIRATIRSLGPIGFGLISALFGIVVWIIYDLGLLEPSNVSGLIWIIGFLLAMKLAIGMSWSFVRRKMSGQIDDTDAD